MGTSLWTWKVKTSLSQLLSLVVIGSKLLLLNFHLFSPFFGFRFPPIPNFPWQTFCHLLQCSPLPPSTFTSLNCLWPLIFLSCSYLRFCSTSTSPTSILCCYLQQSFIYVLTSSTTSFASAFASSIYCCCSHLLCLFLCLCSLPLSLQPPPVTALEPPDSPSPAVLPGGEVVGTEVRWRGMRLG